MMLLLLASLLFFVDAGEYCKSFNLAKGKEDPCKGEDTIEKCYAKKGCEWIHTIDGAKKYTVDLSDASIKGGVPKAPEKVKAGADIELSTKLMAILDSKEEDDLTGITIMNYKLKGKDTTVEEYTYSKEYIDYFKSNGEKVFEAHKPFMDKPKAITVKPKTQTQSERRLIASLHDTVNGTTSNDTLFRRRLRAVGHYYTTGDDPLPIETLPYSAVGWLRTFTYDQDSTQWKWGNCVAALIKSILRANDYYDYVITAAHCVYTEDSKIDDPTGDDDPRHFNRLTSFYRATNREDKLEAVSNRAADLLEVWAGLYTNGQDREHDWAILKYRQPNGNQDAAAAAVARTSRNSFFARSYRLITYGKYEDRYRAFRSQRQSYWKKVTANQRTPRAIKVTPRYTFKGMSGSPLFEKPYLARYKLVGVHSGITGEERDGKYSEYSVHKIFTRSDVITYYGIMNDNWDRYRLEGIDWNWDPRKNPQGDGLRARDIHLSNRLMDEFASYDGPRSHLKSLHHKKSVSSQSALDLGIPNHDVNTHHYYHHEHGYEDKYEHDTYLDGYSDYNYDYEQTKLLLAIPLILLTICVVCIGCLCCAGFGGIAGWFIKHESKGSIKNRKNDYIQALNDNEASDI